MHTSLRLHDVDFNPVTGELSRAGTTVRLEPQPAALLAHLAARRGELVTRHELARLLWKSDTHVNFDDGVNYAIRHIRVALGDHARAPRFIETVPKRGYRLIVPVSQCGSRDGDPAPELSATATTHPTLTARPPATAARPPVPATRLPVSATRLRLRRPALIAAAFVLTIVAIERLESRPNQHHELTVQVLQSVHDVVFARHRAVTPSSSALPQ